MESKSHKLPVRYIPQTKGVMPLRKRVDELSVGNNGLNSNREREISRVNVKVNALEKESTSSNQDYETGIGGVNFQFFSASEPELEDDVKDEIESILDELSLEKESTSSSHDYEKGISGVNFQFYSAPQPEIEANVDDENKSIIDETSPNKESSYLNHDISYRVDFKISSLEPEVEAEVNDESGNTIDETSLKKESSYFSQYYEKGIVQTDVEVIVISDDEAEADVNDENKNMMAENIQSSSVVPSVGKVKKNRKRKISRESLPQLVAVARKACDSQGLLFD